MASLRTWQRVVSLFGCIWLAAGGGLFFLTYRMGEKILNESASTPAGYLPVILAAAACAIFGMIALLNGSMLLFPSRQTDRRCLWMTGMLFLLFPFGSILAAATYGVLHKREVRERADRERQREQ